ncbi:MAG: Hsp70 family protein, partial [Treponema sp.]|nr:Hsp70 family protein [Treponema sp.]
NGIVKVSAKDMGTGKEQKIQIQNSSGLSEDEINRMVKDAEANAESDKKKREEVDARNEADSLVYQTEKAVKDYGDKVSADDKSKIEAAINDLKEALKGSDIAAIKAKTEALKQASYKIAEEMYKAQNAGAGAAGGPGAGAAGADAGAGAADSGNGPKTDSKFDKGSADDVQYEVH